MSVCLCCILRRMADVLQERTITSGRDCSDPERCIEAPLVENEDSERAKSNLKIHLYETRDAVLQDNPFSILLPVSFNSNSPLLRLYPPLLQIFSHIVGLSLSTANLALQTRRRLPTPQAQARMTATVTTRLCRSPSSVLQVRRRNDFK